MVVYNNILAGASGQTSGATAFQIDRSLRFNKADSAYLNRTPSSAGNRKTWTWSGWVKRANSDSDHHLFVGDKASSESLSNSTFGRFYIASNGKLYFSGYTTSYRVTSALLRDPASWYHLVVALDTSESTANDRVKIYINGSQITDFDTENNPSQNDNLGFNTATPHTIGARSRSGTIAHHHDGYLAEVNFVDGLALAATDFGQYDDNNVWQPKQYSGTYGTNGFRLAFADNSSNSALGNDSSGNDNDWTVNNLTATAGTVYSATSSGMSNPGLMFDGDTSTSPSLTADGTAYTMLTGVSIPCSSSLRINANANSFQVSVNGGSYTSAASVNSTYLSLSVPSGNTLTSLTFKDGAGGGYGVRALEVDGTVLVDGDPSAVDSLIDTPTNGTQSDTGAGGEVSGNYATLNPLAKSTNVTLSNGNLDYTAPNAASTYGSALSTIGVSSGKWYAEYVWTSGSTNSHVGIATGDINLETWLGNNAGAYTYFATGIKYNNGTSASYGASYANGDVIGVAFDADNGTLEFYKNGTSQGTAYTGLTNGPYFFGTGMGTAGQTATFNFGQRAFAYSAPSGYKALCTTNLPTPTIADGSDYFDTALYTGNGANSRTISGLGFSPDFLWVKNRDNTAGDFSHRLMDAVRGAGIALSSNSNAVERDNSAQPGGGVETFTSDGFTIEQGTSTNDNQNKNNSTYVAWAWDAGSSTVSNTNGSITSSVRANQTAGFSIVSYTGDGSTTTWGHGLSVAPKLIFFKRRNNANNWFVLADLGVHSGFSVFEGLNNTNAAGDYSSNASASNTIVTLPNTTDWNASGGTYIAYCFSPVASYSAMGSYEGNNSSDGPYVYTGFKVAFLLVKNADGSHPWNIFDAARSPDNVITKGLQPNSSGAEYDSTDRVDFLSNGFKIRSSGSTEPNLSGNTYIYYAVAENPFQANGGLAR